MRFRSLKRSLVLLGVLLAASARATAQYVVVDLGTIGDADGSTSGANALNESGQVVGASTTSVSGEQHAFLWQSGVMTDLGTLGGTFSAAYAVNASGQVVGSSTTAGDDMHAFSWQSGVMTDLGTLGGTFSQALELNASGQVVGLSTTIAGDTHAFSWQSGVMTDLGTLGGTFSGAAAVNASGLVVGFSYLSDGVTRRAFSWTLAGGMIDLGSLGDSAADASDAIAVNDSGQIVGSSTTAGGETHAFSWTLAGGMMDLGTFGGTFSEAVAVNANGQVVGSSTTIGDATTHAFSWTETDRMTDLGNTLGGSYSRAFALNDNGQVVGWASTSVLYQLPAFSWTEAGGMVPLPTLGGRVGAPYAVNSSGQIAGFSFYFETDGHAVLWAVPDDTVPPSVTVTSPNGGEKLFVGVPYTVTFTASDNVALSSVTVEYSTNGLSWTTICSFPGAASSCVFTPSATTATGRIRVRAEDTAPTPNAASDTSNAVFRVVAGAPVITVTVPSATKIEWKIGTFHDIKWTHNLGLQSFVQIDVSRDNGLTWAPVATVQNSAATTGSTIWAVTGSATTKARIRVLWTSNTAIADASDNPFAVVSRVQVTQPNDAGTSWPAGRAKTIKWKHNYGLSHSFEIAIDRDGNQVCEELIATGVPASTSTAGSYSWLVSGPAGTNNRICVSSMSDLPYGTDISDFPFTITP